MRHSGWCFAGSRTRRLTKISVRVKSFNDGVNGMGNGPCCSNALERVHVSVSFKGAGLFFFCRNDLYQ